MSDRHWTPGLVLAAYAESWISGAKVVVFGSASSMLPERLVERGARLVQVYDPDALRVAEATALPHPRQITYAAFDAASNGAAGPQSAAALQQRDGSFDFGLIEDLTALGPSAEPWLEALGRSLSRRGMALIASRNPDVERTLTRSPILTGRDGEATPLGYYELFEKVNERFSEVRMLGQTAFVGYAIADFAAEEDSDIRIDTAFLPNGAEEPEWFLALVSRLPATAEAFSVIQIPFAEMGEPANDREQTEAPHAAAALREHEALRDKEALRERETSSAALSLLKTELAKRDEWAKALESRAATADQRADEVQAELDQLQADKSRIERELEQLTKSATETARAKKKAEDTARALERERDELLRDKTGLLQDNATLSRDKTELSREKTELSRDKSELSRDKTELSREKAERTRVEAELSREKAERTRVEAELSREKAERTREKTERDQERAREKAERTRAEGDWAARRLTLEQRIDQLSKELRASEEKVLQLSKRDESERSELAALEAQMETQLRERGAEVTRLEAALRETERFGRQLIVELNGYRNAASRDTQRDLSELSRRNAELQADLEAARWTIASLEASQTEDATEPRVRALVEPAKSPRAGTPEPDGVPLPSFDTPGNGAS